MSLIDFLNRTMIIERMIGICVYLFLTLYIYNKLNKCTTKRNLNLYYNVCIVILGLMAFFYIPKQEADLYRWLEITKSWKNLSFTDFYDRLLSKSGTPIAYMLMYLCSKVDISGLLPCVCAVVFYINVFSVLKDISYQNISDDKLGNEGFLFIVFMSAGSFLEVISGVRCFVAFSFIAKAFYFEIYRDRKIIWSFPIYIVAAFTHNAVIPIIVIRLIYYIFQKSQNIIKKLFNLAIIILCSFVIYHYGKIYITSSFDKANGYISNQSYSYFWEYVIGALQWILFLYIILKTQKLANYPISLRNIIGINKLLLFTELLLCFEYNIFHRMILISSIMILPALNHLLLYERENMRHYRFVRNMTILVFVIACVRGNLCGYRFFTL